MLIFVIIGMTLLASYVPFILGRSKVRGLVTILTFMTCFAAGIILAGAFNHLLPDASENFEQYFAAADPDNQYADFPYAETIAIFVMFMLVALDKLVIEGGVVGGGHTGHNHMDVSHHLTESTVLIDQSLSTSTPGYTEGGGGIVLVPTSISVVDDGAQTIHVIMDNNGAGVGAGGDGVGHGQKVDNGKTHAANVSQAWIFMLALSVHSIFDGLGLGAETDPSNFYGLMVAVLAHKALDGFALGVPVFYAKFSRLQTALALSFCAAMTPLGIGIGMAIASLYQGTQAYLSEGIILSVTTGSFLYISLIELMPSGLGQPGWMKTKLFLTFIGWALLAVIALWV
ncbi:hypothetical protein SAMD00019534_001320 [Acytostelium subglobosum LB1]|uniref:hypothetical protein n=1 Tax=Acytostelium subglobosum LB1 TaxID=1410327 RepID=UPI0006451B1B|nr:hypothetical protein SAMD00019534_001320 [Acytostelium subglobosum LB1]GAM16957.1 hypothetical protein SAMD00019534_001320 [Acytostelium subglobosum LB1]|eukprot:XP_012759019.1 hypothetical protein SAMD00019534_001320 [Acytostelium subglobosum LB1]